MSRPSGPAEDLINAFYVAPPATGGGVDVDPTARAAGALLGGRGWVHQALLGGISDPPARQLAFVLLKIAAYCAAAWVCYRRRWFWKI